MVVVLGTVHRVRVHRKGVVVIPAEVRRRYGIREGGEVALVEEGGRLVLVPVQGISEVFGLGREYGSVIDLMVREVEEERRREAGPGHRGADAGSQG